MVSLIAIGNKAIERATEDDECARYIQSKLKGERVDLEEMKKAILACLGADRLRRLEQEDDLDFCLTLNSCQTVPYFDREKGVILSFVQADDISLPA